MPVSQLGQDMVRNNLWLPKKSSNRKRKQHGVMAPAYHWVERNPQDRRVRSKLHKQRINISWAVDGIGIRVALRMQILRVRVPHGPPNNSDIV